MPHPAAEAGPWLDARPPEAFSRIDAHGAPWPEPRARRREQRRCEGVWVLPVTLGPGLVVSLADGWGSAFQRMPTHSLLKHGDVWECPVRLDPAVGWPTGALALVLMLWPRVDRSFLGQDPVSAALAASAIADVESGRAAAADGSPDAGADATVPQDAAVPAAAPDTAPFPLGALTAHQITVLLDALELALAEQGRAGGSLASGLLTVPIA